MLKRFNFFATEETSLPSHEAQHHGPGLPAPSGTGASDIGQIQCMAGGGSPFLLVANKNAQLFAIDRKMRIAGQVSAHSKHISLLKQLATRPVAITIGDGPDSAGFSSESTLHTSIKFWSIDLDNPLDRSNLTSEQHAKFTLIRSLTLGAALIKEKSRPRWIVPDPAQMGTSFTWPHVTCLEVTEDLTQMALGFSDGLVVLIRSDPHSSAPLLSNLVELATSRAHAAALGSLGIGNTDDAKHSLLHDKGHLYTTIQTASSVPSVPVTGLGFCRTASGSLYLWVANESCLRSYKTNAVVSSGPVSRRGSFPGLKNARLADVEIGPELDAEGCAMNCSCVAYPLPPVPTVSNTQATSFLSVQVSDTVNGTNGGTSRSISAVSDKTDRVGKSQDRGLSSISTQSPISTSFRQAEFVTAKADRVEFFSYDDPRAVYAVLGQKRFVSWFRNCLVVVARGKSGLSLGVQNALGLTESSMASNVPPDVVQLYDFRNKFVAANLTLRDEDTGRVLAVSQQWNRLVILTSTGRVFLLKEKDTQTKLDDLLQRNLYATALSLARSSGVDDAQIMDIHRTYGDHLYAKGSYDDSIVQYCQTISRLEPSYVIRRFLDSQRLENLITYLEALHTNSSQAPTGDHTTLLLNCYTKQKMEDKLEKFVSNKEITAAIDVQAAVAVLRTARYYDLAIQLAKEHKQHALCLQILLEETDQHEQALDYLRDLPVSIANSHLQAYGKHLMRRLPDATTAAIQKICCTPNEWDGMQRHHETVIELPHPEDFIHIFVDHRAHLERFLEAVVEERHGQLATPAIWNTYLELLLSSRSTSDSKARDEAEQNAMSVLKNPNASYDPHHALVLVQSAGFQRGLLFLYERLHMYHMLIRHYMEVGDSAAILTNCKAYGAKDPNLWMQVLQYFASQYEESSNEGVDKGSNSSVEKDLQEVLKQIERFRILPPLVVVETLSSNPNIRLSMIRPYIRSQLDVSQHQIEELSKDIQHLRKDTEKMKQEVEQLRTQPKVFTNTKYTSNGVPLELPTVHFLSGHSYNLNDLPGGKVAADAAAAATSQFPGPAPHDRMLEDPECVNEQHAVADIMFKLRQNAEHVDEEFFNQLEISPDGFSTVAEYFSKCLFEPPRNKS